MSDEQQRRHAATLNRSLAIWCGSVALASAVLIVYFHAPLGPLVIAAGATLIITILRSVTRR